MSWVYKVACVCLQVCPNLIAPFDVQRTFSCKQDTVKHLAAKETLAVLRDISDV